jgi:RsmE family RNA methyltransferase
MVIPSSWSDAVNRIILEPEEIIGGVAVVGGRRARHIASVLKAGPGKELAIGVVNGWIGAGVVRQVADAEVVLECRLTGPASSEPDVDVVLAMPRPKVMKRLWAPLAAMGVRRVVLVNAEEVERVYFDTHWIEEANYRPLLIEGLEQSGATRLPRVEIRRRFKPFVEDELEGLVAGGRRLVLDPRGGRFPGDLAESAGAGVAVAIGPEGGWTGYELGLLDECGFQRVSLGWRVLRSDVACIAALGAVMAARG